MGAWSHLPLGNDDACDFLLAVLDSEDDGPLIEALAAVVEAPEGQYLEVDTGSFAVAAVDVIVRLAGGAGSKPHEELDAWVADQEASARAAIVGKLAPFARLALVRVAGPDSELAELWDEGDGRAWRATLTALADALPGAGSSPR